MSPELPRVESNLRTEGNIRIRAKATSRYERYLDELQKAKSIMFRRDGQALEGPSGWPSKELTGWVYAFWWRGGTRHFIQAAQRRCLDFAGPRGTTVRFHLTDNSVSVAENHFVPLYVGKTAGPIKKRIGLHLKLRTRRTVGGGRKSHRMSTSSQVRYALDRLRPSDRDTRKILRERLLLSYVRMGDFVERFYFENYAIGLLRPVCNLDAER